VFTSGLPDALDRIGSLVRRFHEWFALGDDPNSKPDFGNGVVDWVYFCRGCCSGRAARR